jgi:hypothetical protein
MLLIILLISLRLSDNDGRFYEDPEISSEVCLKAEWNDCWTGHLFQFYNGVLRHVTQPRKLIPHFCCYLYQGQFLRDVQMSGLPADYLAVL